MLQIKLYKYSYNVYNLIVKIYLGGGTVKIWKNKLHISIMAYLELMYTLFFKILNILYPIYIIYFLLTEANSPMLNISKIVSLISMSLVLSMATISEAIKNK